MTEHRELDAQDAGGQGRAEQQFHKISSRVRRLELSELKADAWNSAMTSGIN